MEDEGNMIGVYPYMEACKGIPMPVVIMIHVCVCICVALYQFNKCILWISTRRILYTCSYNLIIIGFFL